GAGWSGLTPTRFPIRGSRRYRSGLGSSRSTFNHNQMPADSRHAIPHSVSVQSPTGTRHWVLVFASSLAVITFIDRVCMSQTKLSIAAELKLSDVQMGWVFSA